MKQFKKQYINAKVMVRTEFGQKIEIDTSTADPKKWSKIKEFNFLFEDSTNQSVKESPIEEPTETQTENGDNLESKSLKELREDFPYITARSKKEFITELNEHPNYQND